MDKVELQTLYDNSRDKMKIFELEGEKFRLIEGSEIKYFGSVPRVNGGEEYLRHLFSAPASPSKKEKLVLAKEISFFLFLKRHKFEDFDKAIWS